MDTLLFILAIAFVAIVILLKVIFPTTKKPKAIIKDDSPIEHTKKEYLATKNEQKLYFALQKALSDKYHIHCQTSLIAIVEPVEFKDKKRAYTKRMDFVITDTATKIIAVIELDDASHNAPKRIARDKYVNEALQPHHPLIRINTTPFYQPENIAELLEQQAGIKNTLAVANNHSTISNKQDNKKIIHKNS